MHSEAGGTTRGDTLLIKTGHVSQIDYRPGLIRQHGRLKRPTVHGIHGNDENAQIGKSGRVEQIKLIGA